MAALLVVAIVASVLVLRGQMKTQTPDLTPPGPGPDATFKTPQVNGVKTTGPGTKATPPQDNAPPPNELEALILELGKDLADAEKAELRILEIGKPMLPYLEKGKESENLEIRARCKALLAKIGARVKIPEGSYAEALPPETLLFAEALDWKKSYARFWESPLGKIMALPEQKRFWWSKYIPSEKEEYQELFTEAVKLTEMGDGRVAALLGPPSSFQEDDLAAPFVFLIEARGQDDAMRQQMDRFWKGMDDEPDTQEVYGAFTLNNHGITGGSTVYNEGACYHALTPHSLKCLLDSFGTRPESSIAGDTAAARKLLDDPDIVFYANSAKLQEIASFNHEFDLDYWPTLASLGYADGSTVYGAIKATPRGFEEAYRAKFTDPAGLIPVLSTLEAAPPVAASANAEDAIAADASLWFSVRGEVSAQAAALGKVLRDLDKQTTETPRQGGPEASDPRYIRLYVKRIDRLETLGGVKFEQLLGSLKGGVAFALYFHAVPADDTPDEMPLGLVFSATLKDPALAQRALEYAVQSQPKIVSKEDLDGGAFYFQPEDTLKAGWWLKGERLVFVSEFAMMKSVAEALADPAKRMTERTDVKEYLAKEAAEPWRRLLCHAETANTLETMYRLAKVNWGDDDDLKFPTFGPIKALLGSATLCAGIDPQSGLLDVRIVSPLTFVGMIETIRRIFDEVGSWKI
ncbi:MAG: hypothetical protein L6R28_16015, partial [Planctomycetes bacterium]|nr:hypothetical protein [Planctomycetota bacterium]